MDLFPLRRASKILCAAWVHTDRGKRAHDFMPQLREDAGRYYPDGARMIFLVAGDWQMGESFEKSLDNGRNPDNAPQPKDNTKIRILIGNLRTIAAKASYLADELEEMLREAER